MAPVIDIDASVLHDAPFSQSFSGMLSDEVVEVSPRDTILIDASFDQIKDIREIVPEWDDDEVDEIIVLFSKPKNKMPNRLSTIMEDLKELDKKQSSNFSLAEFDFLPSIPRNGNLMVIRKRDTKQRYTFKRFKTTPSHTWPVELSVLEMINDRDAQFLPQICWRIFEDGCFSVILNFYPSGNLSSYVTSRGPLSPEHTLVYAAELVEGLSVIHATGIHHRNVTPENIMIDATGHLVLVGFDCAQIENDKDRFHDTILLPIETQPDFDYRAPELLLGWSHDSAVDCWSFGCVMYFMIAGKHPFSKDKDRIMRGCHSDVLDVEQVVRDLITKCLEPNPGLRLTIAEIKAHEYFAAVNWSLVQEKNVTVPNVPSEEHLKTASMSSKTSILPLPSPAFDSPTLLHSDNYSLQARQSVQDLLPSIFRMASNTSDTHSLKNTKSTIGSSVSTHSINPEYSLPASAPAYDSLRCRLNENSSAAELTPEERMARFWVSLDEGDDFSPELENCHYIPTRLQRQRRKKPRKASSPSTRHLPLTSRSSLSLSLASTQRRISKLIKFRPHKTTPASQATIRKHESLPCLNHDLPPVPEPVPLHLPKGIEQIGNGIGFTYHAPQPVPLPSPLVTDHLGAKRRQIGLGLKFKMSSISHRRKWGSGLGLFTTSTSGSGVSESYDDSHSKMAMSAKKSVSIRGRDPTVEQVRVSESSLGVGVRLDKGSGSEAEKADVFRYGSTWSLMPDLSNSGELSRMVAASGEVQVSPVTETDTTVGNSPFADLNLDERELLGRRSTLRLVL
uniref:Putative AGC/AGC-Unique protein kinase n=1 Tax=Moniliophthora roreri TaxID=221103 RepID=A0A0W0F726_MONRR